MSDIYVALVYLSFMVLGASAPFVAALGYVWTDSFLPQYLSNLVALIPSSMTMGVAAVVLYITMDRRAPPRLTAQAVLTICFGLWCTATLMWAEVPDQAWLKWDWAVKTVMFSSVLPLVIRSRVQIETFIQVYIAALMIHILPVGVKTLLSGGAYGLSKSIIRVDSGLTESSTLAAISVGIIPLLMYIGRYSIIIPARRWRYPGYLALIGFACYAALGTYARTAIFGFAVVGIHLFIESRRKGLYVLGAILAISIVIGYSAATWKERMATTADFSSENSALGRLLVWQWTLNYVTTHPLGGGFTNYVVNSITFIDDDGAPTVFRGKAYHNIYFEVLGEHGFPGILLFTSIILMSVRSAIRTIKRTRGIDHLAWLHRLSRASLASLLSILACGMFIGVAFQAFLWYFLMLPLCLSQYLARVDALETIEAKAVERPRATTHQTVNLRDSFAG